MGLNSLPPLQYPHPALGPSVTSPLPNFFLAPPVSFSEQYACIVVCIQLPPISLRSTYPQQMVPVGGCPRAVGATHRAAGSSARLGAAAAGCYDDDDEEDIDDDFNWDGLIAKDNEVTCAV